MNGDESTPRPLWQHQERVIAELRACMIAGKRRVMIQLPTGGGKTRLAAEIIKGALAKSKKIAFVVPRISLIDQTSRAFAAEGIDCAGIMQADHPGFDPDAPVQICSVQTLARRQRPLVDLVVVDESHLLFKPAVAWLEDQDQRHVRFVGLSATPWTSGLGRLYDDLIIGATISELILAGRLSPFRAFAPSEPDLAGVRTIAGNFHEGELAERCDTTKLVGDVVTEWLKRGDDRQTLSFGVNRAHAAHIQQRFLEAGVAAEYIDAFVDRRERELIFDRFRSGETKIISSIATLETGIDLPTCSCIVDARPTKSRMSFVQRIGRGLRIAPGKTDCIVLDHGGNCLRLGLPTDIHQDHLDDGDSAKSKKNESKERAEPLPKLCDECEAIIPPRAKECPGCHAPILMRTTIEHEVGELVEMGARRSGKAETEVWEKRRFFSELLSLRKPHHKPHWPDAMFKVKFGHWPNGYERIQAEPSIATRSWVKSRQIAWAKAREGRAHA